MRRSPSCLGLLAWLGRVVPRLVCRLVGRGGLPLRYAPRPVSRVVGRGDRCRIVLGAVCLLAHVCVCVDGVLPVIVRLYSSVMLYI